MTELNFKQELEQMRQNYKKSPMNNIRLLRPQWLKKDDPMYEVYEKKKDLLQHGQVVYAQIVQANSMLFRRYPNWDCPGDIVYSTEPYFAEHPEVLQEIAKVVFSYKGRDLNEVPEEWRDVAMAVTDEMARESFVYSISLEGQNLQFSIIPTMIFRKLLPKKKLCGGLLPVLTAEGCTQILILPKKYWSDSFKNAWIKGQI